MHTKIYIQFIYYLLTLWMQCIFNETDRRYLYMWVDCIRVYSFVISEKSSTSSEEEERKRVRVC